MTKNQNKYPGVNISHSFGAFTFPIPTDTKTRKYLRMTF